MVKSKNFLVLLFSVFILMTAFAGINKIYAACNPTQNSACGSFSANGTKAACTDSGIRSGFDFACTLTYNTGAGKPCLNITNLSFPSSNQSLVCTSSSATVCTCKTQFANTDIPSNLTSGSTTGSSPTPTSSSSSNSNTSNSGTSDPSKIIDSPTPGIKSVGDLLSKFLGFIPLVIGLLLLGYLVYGGILILTSGAQDEKKAQGIKVITNAIIGVVVVILSLTIIIFIQALLGSPILFGLGVK